MKTTIAGIAFIALILTGCGGMGQIKREFSGKPTINVFNLDQDIILKLEGIAAGEVMGTAKTGKEIEQLSQVVADTLIRELANPNIKVGDIKSIPKKRLELSFDNEEVPDWSKADQKLIVFTATSISYIVTPSSDGVPPYRYKLKARTSLFVSKNKGGNMKSLMPEGNRIFDLGYVEKDIDLSTGQIRGIEALMKVMPPETILPVLKERTSEGVKRFINAL